MSDLLLEDIQRLLARVRFEARVEYWSGNRGQAEALEFMCLELERLFRAHSIEVAPGYPRGVSDSGSLYRPFHFTPSLPMSAV